MFYTFSLGPHIRFLLMDAEDEWGTADMKSNQVQWARSVLHEAKSKHQFIFAAFHRPLYCTSTGPSCFSEKTYFQGKIEDSFIEFNVTMVHTGHVHNYERSYPVAHNVRQSDNYDNTTAPVCFVNGAPG